MAVVLAAMPWAMAVAAVAVAICWLASMSTPETASPFPSVPVDGEAARAIATVQMDKPHRLERCSRSPVVRAVCRPRWVDWVAKVERAVALRER